jgi:bifunctional UDP-N-acetylglucosamine pyrophosphorylase/glucosamine-1-phosphate N-acetyltransferase
LLNGLKNGRGEQKIMTISIIILAAGQGKRMHSALPKVLHSLAGKPLIAHVIDTALAVAPEQTPIIVYGHQGQLLQEKLAHLSVRWAHQAEQQGTGHAVQQALPLIPDTDQVLILYGDVPLISYATLKQLIITTPETNLGIVTAHLQNPAGYGRIKRDANQHVMAVIEEKDATPHERDIQEINSGIYFLQASYLKKWLPRLQNKNQQSEYYLPDIVAFAQQEKLPIHTVSPTVNEEIFGVNDRVQLAHLERFYQHLQAEKLMRSGVTVYDPTRVDIRGDVSVGQDTVIDVNVVLEGHVVIGKRCVIGPHVVLRHARLGDDVEVRAHSIIEGAEVAAHCTLGPFARLRPGTVLATKVHIGNFVEIKNSVIDQGTKINHLSYIGDSEIGKRTNIGAGTITCNYDGVNKHKTIIGDDVFIGSDTALVAPVTVGNGATLGAGSILTKDAPAHQLTLTQKMEQRSIKDWVRPVKEE